MDLLEAQHRKGEYRHPWEIARLNAVCRLGKTTLEALNESGGLLLDVGCGDTWFAEQLTLRFPKLRIAAVDILFTDELLSSLREKYNGTNIQVFRSVDDAQAAIGSDKAGMVLLLDVIEHIEDDIEFLKWLSAFSCIDDHTRFLITVPAYQWLFGNHDHFLKHFMRYTNHSLKNHIQQAGLSELTSGYFFLSLLMARILGWTKDRLTGNKKQTTGLVEWEGGKTATGLIAGLLQFDFSTGQLFRKLGLKVPGLSNYILCKKSA